MKNSRSLNHQLQANTIIFQYKIIFSIYLTQFSRPALIQVNQNPVEIHHRSLIFLNLANKLSLAQELLLLKERKDWKYLVKNRLRKIFKLFYRAIWSKTFHKHSRKIEWSIHLLQEINQLTFLWLRGENLVSLIKIAYSFPPSK